MKTGLAPVCLACLVAVGTAASAKEPGKNKQGDVNVFVKGGVGTFTGELKDVAQAGPAWGVTLNLQPWNVIGFELGYDGSRHALVGDGDGSVLRNGGTALVKLGLPFIEKVRPFVGGGLGATYVSANASDAVRSDLMEEVPLLAGIEFNLGAITAGVRGGYRFLIDEGFASPSGDPDGGLVDITASLGGRF